jgi:hypothetical protein
MSHHRDCPGARAIPELDITDLFVFRGAGGTVLVLDVNGGFHPRGRYEFKIDGDGDTVEDLAYRFTFGPDGTLRLRRLAGVAARDPEASGTVIATGTVGEATTAAGGLMVWTGRAGDPYWVEPVVLRAVGAAFATGTRADLSGWHPSVATNELAGHTVHAIVLEIPDEHLLPIAKPNKHIGVWATTSLLTDAGGWRQVNRAGHPMIHALFTQHDGELGDELNAGRPFDDGAAFGKTIAEAVSAVVGAYGTAEDPQAYGMAVAARLFPDILPYTIGTPATFGFAEMNGRALTDNAAEVMFSLATNTAFPTGLTKDAVVTKPTRTFPYVPAPPG